MKKIRSCRGCKHRKLRFFLFLPRSDWCKLNKCTCDQARYGYSFASCALQIVIEEKPKCTLKTKNKKNTTIWRQL